MNVASSVRAGAGAGAGTPPLAPPALSEALLHGAWHAVCRAWKLSRLFDAARAANLCGPSEGHTLTQADLPALLAATLCIPLSSAHTLATQVIEHYGGSSKPSAMRNPSGSGGGVDFAAFLGNERGSLKLAMQLISSKLTPAGCAEGEVFACANELLVASCALLHLPCTAVRRDEQRQQEPQQRGGKVESVAVDAHSLALLLEVCLRRSTTLEERRALYGAALSATSGGGIKGVSSEAATRMSILHGRNSSGSHLSLSEGPLSGGDSIVTALPLATAAPPPPAPPLVPLTEFVANAINFAVNDFASALELDSGDDLQSTSILTPQRDARTGTPTSQCEEADLLEPDQSLTLMYASNNTAQPPAAPGGGAAAAVPGRMDAHNGGTRSGAGERTRAGEQAEKRDEKGEAPATGFASSRAARCRATSPVLLQPLQLDTASSEGQRRFMSAEQRLERSQLGAAWDEAASLFDRAATQLAYDGEHLLAGHAYVRCADCKHFLDDASSVAACLHDAAHAYERVDVAQAIAALDAAADAYRGIGRALKAAKIACEVGELEARRGNLDAALERYELAASVFGDELGLASETRAALLRAADIALVELSDWGRAIELLERAVAVASEPERPLLLCRAAACRLACVPPELSAEFLDALHDMSATLARYVDDCPLLLRSGELALMSALTECTAQGDADGAEAAIGRYEAGHCVAPALAAVLRLAHSNILTRKASVEKLYRMTAV